MILVLCFIQVGLEFASMVHFFVALTYLEAIHIYQVLTYKFSSRLYNQAFVGLNQLPLLSLTLYACMLEAPPPPPPRDPKVPLTFDEMWFNADDEIQVRTYYGVSAKEFVQLVFFLLLLPPRCLKLSTLTLQ